MIFTVVLGVSAFLISLVAGYFSVTGLSMIFPAAPVAVMIMGIALELGKLVTASWLYRFWGTASKLLKGYFVTAVVVLSLVTSLGIFGFLSRAHIAGEATRGVLSTKIVAIDTRLAQLQQQQTTLGSRIQSMDRMTNTLSSSPAGIRRITQIQRSQGPERTRIDSVYAAVQRQIDSLSAEKIRLQTEEKTGAAEIGPLVYIADLLYDDGSTDKAARLLILIIMSVFDPLAILLVVATNMQIATLRGRIATVDSSFEPDTWFKMVDTPLTDQSPSATLDS